jgi:hypothetical protein
MFAALGDVIFDVDQVALAGWTRWKWDLRSLLLPKKV